MPTTLTLERTSLRGPQLTFTCALDGLRFHTTLWYQGVDLEALEARYGAAFMRRIWFHIAAFDVNKVASLRPDRFDPGPFADLCTPAFQALWSEVFRNVWAQWRYENDLPDYAGPTFTHTAPEQGSPRSVTPGPTPLLSLCGGGKDSLVSMGLLDRAGLAYDTLAYAHSVYGTSSRQHALIDGLIDHAHPRARQRMWVFDDFLDAPVLALAPTPGVSTLTAAETPASVFATLPLALARGYTRVALGHERSADTGNLVWAATGEEVNHQWGKSLEAERLLQGYVRAHLVEDLTVFSLLKPLHDVVIFAALGRHLDAVPATHSCNVQKPWCGRCPKCAYVWLNYMAWLPRPLVDGVFGRNLLDEPANQLAFRQMLGLEAHTPFECIGQIDEARLAFALCRARGLRGAAMDTFVAALGDWDPAPSLPRLTRVWEQDCAMPAEVAAAVLPRMREDGHRARAHITDTLKR